MANHFLTRRHVLKASVAASVGTGHFMQVAAKPVTPAPSLVVFLLRGGMDGLSLVVPYGERAYYEARDHIALQPPGQAQGLLPLDRRFGLHPAAAPLVRYWEAGSLAFVHASGSTHPTRSHFDAQDFMESGTPGIKSTTTGWLGRLASVLASDGSALRSPSLHHVALGPDNPRIFAGNVAPHSLATFFGGPRLADDARLASAFSRVYNGDDAMSRSVHEAIVSRPSRKEEMHADHRQEQAGGLPLSVLARNTADLGRLIALDARVRLAFVPVVGWDTHFRQGGARGQLAARFALLAQALQALAGGLGDRLSNTVILVMSEFGRSVVENGTGGTDHGHGNVAMLLGAGTCGGKVHGAWPGIDSTALHEGRDLAVTTDFQDIVADVLERHFYLTDAELTSVLPLLRRRRSVGLFT
jgi:uncharacterized protein (DUF1501 family)